FWGTGIRSFRATLEVALMTAAEIIGKVVEAGGKVASDGADLVLTAGRPLPADLLDRLKAHKADILAALAMTDQAAAPRGARTSLSTAALAELPPEDAACPSWRVSIVGPKALNIELEMRSAWTVSDWGRFARCHYDPGATVVARACPKPEAGTEEGAAEGLRLNLLGVSPEFAARLSPEDLNDIATGDIPIETVQAFEQAAIAREAEDLKEFFEERAGILEHDAGLPMPEAALEAARITTTLARNRGYLWASLRAVLAEYPALLAVLPDRPGPVDALTFGVANAWAPCGAPGGVRRGA
ncbi:MAG: hypothetical protein ACREX8_14010, partial [Gammaproteobacteria bacterium]